MPAGRPAGRPEISLRKSLRKSLSPAQPTPCFEKGPRSLLENGRFLRPHEAYSFFANGPLLRPKSSKGGAFELSGWAGDLFFSRSKKSIFSPMRLTPPLQMDHCWDPMRRAPPLKMDLNPCLKMDHPAHPLLLSLSLTHRHSYTKLYRNLYWKNSLNSIENPIQIPL